MSEEELNRAVAAATQRSFSEVAKAVNEKHPGAYLQPLFKNAYKCRELLVKDPDDRQSTLFPSGDAT